MTTNEALVWLLKNHVIQRDFEKKTVIHALRRNRLELAIAPAIQHKKELSRKIISYLFNPCHTKDLVRRDNGPKLDKQEIKK